MVAQFFQQGLQLMAGDADISQEAVRGLAKEEGLKFVKHALDHQVPQAGDNPTKVKALTALIVPLFRWVTHPRVVDSAVLEQEVAVIFNFMLGVGGRRMMALFNFTTSCLDSWPTLKVTEISRIELIELSVPVLSKILECNTVNVVNEGFTQLSDKFETLLSEEGANDQSYPYLQSKKYLSYIKLRLNAGQDIPVQQDRKPEPVQREQFVLRRDLPGELSAGGPRHDNDHADIAKIKIMPTAKEILSPRAEYLPTTDSREWHIPGIQGRLDREFRLLREDTIGQLRDTVRARLEAVQNPRGQGSQKSQNIARTYVYTSPLVKDVSFNDLSGLEILVQFDQPHHVQVINILRRQEWWQHCKCLQEGALVCVLDQSGAVLFFEVSDSTLRTGNDEGKKRRDRRHAKQSEEEQDDKEKLSLADNSMHGYVALRLVDSNQQNVTQTLRWHRNIGFSPRRELVEFPGVLLASFKHTLEALQDMSRQPNIPFVDLIAPSEASTGEPHINPPRYVTKPGFTYDMKSIAKDKQSLIIAATEIRRPTTLELVSSRTILDSTQSSAFLDAISRELALVQGPPGTGKSFTGERIIKTLIGTRDKADLGPIICVCYTNHALDQLLEHLLDANIKGIIRIGAQSKSERIQGLTLRNVAQSAQRTKAEGSSLYRLDMQLKGYVREATQTLQTLSHSSSWKAVKAYLLGNHRQHHLELFSHMEADQEGWQQVTHNPDRVIDHWLNQGSRTDTASRPIPILRTVKLSDLTYNERRNLHQDWMRSIRDPLITEIADVEHAFVKTKIQRDRVRRDVDLRCLQEAQVVGLTTTGLAKNLDLLRRLRCKVLVCEEAGEVLEAHLLTALLPSIEHAILVGDHLQLRPQIQNYDLQSTNPRGEKYSLDLSLFERLVKPPHTEDIRLPFSVLQTQRRMHPSISQLIRSTLYPNLEDGGSVESYPEVMGMKKRLFWFHHESLEAGAQADDPTSTSHSNSFEIEMTVALVSHLVRQGEYGPDDIAVLTPYLGQLIKLRRRMESMFEISIGDRDLEDMEALENPKRHALPHIAKGPKPVAKQTLLKSLRVATVDNFQGEEAKVIVISLVRSNPQSKCGFLNTSNRINVLLSRAKHGMYIIGNSNTYRPVPMWSSVIDILRTNGNLGQALELQCPRHPNTPIAVRKPDDFLVYAPESGCNEPCDKRLECGHKCGGRCHSDVLHTAFKCLEACQRLKRGCSHSCPLPCGERCHEKCQTMLTGLSLKLPCGHITKKAHCWQAQDPASIACQEMITKKFPDCGHSVEVRCCVNITALKCETICGGVQECGHACKSKCHKCRFKKGDGIQVNHGICKQVCGRKYTTCPHSCKDTCHGTRKCSPCKAPCEVRCSHSKCSKKCHEPCAPCAESKCTSGCTHSQCAMPCAAPCDFLPCSTRCNIRLNCGHQCPSICGEPCPDVKYCQNCGSESVKSTIVDFIEMKEYHEIDLDTDPCVFPDCGDFMMASSMDGLMDMSAHYEIDPNTGYPSAIKTSSKPFSMNEVKACANCRGPLCNIGRYGRIVRRAMLDEATKKFINWSSEKHLALADRLLAEQEKLGKTQAAAKQAPGANRPAGTTVIVPGRDRLKLVQSLSKAAGSDRYRGLARLWKEISSFEGEVRKEEQPFQSVVDMVTYANQQHKKRGEFVFDDSVLQVKGTVLALSLLLKCDIAVISDFCEIYKDGKLADQYGEVKLDFESHFNACSELVDVARRSKLPRQEVEGHIFYAQLCGFSCSLCPDSDGGTTINQLAGQHNVGAGAGPDRTGKNAELKAKGFVHTAEASRIIAQQQSLGDMTTQVEAVEDMLRNGVFYQAVSPEEMRAVYAAMAGSFRGTGHWYTCENGHPFTVGECGMPMQQVRCPECDAPIGGHDHTPAAGVRRAEEIDELGMGIGRMQM